MGELRDKLKGIILDMDGVLWKGDELILNLQDIFLQISNLGLKVVLATNNSTKSVNQYLRKLASYGVSLESWQIVNSSLAVVSHLRKHYSDGGNVFVIGEDGLIDTLTEYGYSHAASDVIAVVAGLDREITYSKLKRAALLIRSGTPFIGTNADRTLPTPEGLIPGAGAILAALEAATDIKPLVVGKPEVGIYEIALERMNLKPYQTIVVGDRLDTDISGAQTLGCRTGLVLTGVTTPDMAIKWHPKPDLVENDLAGILQAL